MQQLEFDFDWDRWPKRVADVAKLLLRCEAAGIQFRFSQEANRVQFSAPARVSPELVEEMLVNQNDLAECWMARKKVQRRIEVERGMGAVRELLREIERGGRVPAGKLCELRREASNTFTELLRNWPVPAEHLQ